ncbi:hypothetical protein [Tenacibaculum sp. nBUS_03]|uniref:hypothetical protein n=1 Tax=Tenacibaculum sp. nBUS_03 TaxID=3395320 RepID=UPI003EBB4F73
MKRIKIVLPIVMLVMMSSSFGQTSKKRSKLPQQSYTKNTPTALHEAALEVLKASKARISKFNTKSTNAFLQAYSPKATMSVTPHGVKSGTKEISNYWKPLIKSGATDLTYTNVSIEIVNNTTAFLSANWSTNFSRGIIFKEKWEKTQGEWLLTYDNFQILEQFKTSKKSKTNPIASHIILEEVIKASIKWTKGFNAGKKEVCASGYASNATMNATPFEPVNGKTNIEKFWGKLIADGATNLTYHNPTFSAKTNNSVLLSSLWSMNIGEGKIYQEKWEKINNKWVLTYDEFELLKQY